MNKIPLSLAALAAVSVSVNAQTTMTEQELETARLEVQAAINAATNELSNGTYHNEVSEPYLVKVSAVADDLNKSVEAGFINTKKLTDKINTILVLARNLEACYDAKDELTTSYASLKVSYDNALALVAKYTYVADAKKAALEALGIVKIGNDVETYDPATAVMPDETLATRIAAAQKGIDEIADEEALEAENTAIGNNERAYADIAAKVESVKAEWTKAQQDLIALLPNDGVYDDWRKAALNELNEIYLSISAAENANGTKEEHSNAYASYTSNAEKLSTASTDIAATLSNYTTKATAEKNAYAAAQTVITGYNDRLAVVEEQLSTREITVYAGDIAAVKTQVATLVSNVDAQNVKHTISTYDLTAAKDGIEAKLSVLESKAQIAADDFDANNATLESIAAIQNVLNGAVATAEKPSTLDNTYKAAAYFTASQKAIHDAINKLSADANAAFSGDNLYTGAAKTYNAGLGDKIAAIQALIDSYVANTGASLTAFNAAKKTINDNTSALAGLKAAVTDENVTIDGTTYKAVIANIESEIKAITSAINTANGKVEAAHLTGMQAAAALTISEDIAQLKADYEANKAVYDNQSLLSAANEMLNAVDAQIDALKTALTSIDTSVANLGNQADAIRDLVEKQLFEVGKAESEAAKKREDFEGYGTGSDEQLAAAPEIIAYLSQIQDNCILIEKAIEGINAKVEVAAANKDAYDEVIALINVSSAAMNAINKARNDISSLTATANNGNEGIVWFLGEVTRYETEVLVDIETRIENKYATLNSVATKGAFKTEIDQFTKDVLALITAAKANEVAHDSQVDDLATIQNNWQSAYTTILATDQSSLKDSYLDRLTALQDDTNTLAAKVAEAFAKGESDGNTTIEDELARILQDIKTIGDEQSKGYNAAIAADNAAAHKSFTDVAYTQAIQQFMDAVDVLNQFAAIRNEALTEALANLVDAHDAIYAYAEKLRELKGKEQAAYDTVTSPELYIVDDFVNIANQYTEDIAQALKDYQNIVNAEAKKLYKERITYALSQLTAFEGMISDYTYGEKADAFKDVDDLLKDITLAAGNFADVNTVNPMFAVLLDKEGWADKIAATVINEMLANDLEAAAVAEWDYQLGNIDELVESEKAEIAGFEGFFSGKTSQDYLKDLQAAYDRYVGSAKAAYNLIGAGEHYARLSEATSLLAEFEHASTITRPDGTVEGNHTAVFEKAYNDAVKHVDNLEAYGDIVAAVNEALESYNDVAAFVNALFTAHVDKSDVAKLLEFVKNTLDGYLVDAEYKKAHGGCVDLWATVSSNLDADNGGWIGILLNSLRENAITEELTTLEAQITAVEKIYNQAAKVIGVDNEALIKYDKTIIPGLKSTREDLTFDLAAGDVTIDEAHAQLLALELEIATTGQELTDLYNKGALDNEKTALIVDEESDYRKLVADLNQALDWTGAYEDLAGDYGAALTAIQVTLEAFEAEVNAKYESKTLLFYADNLRNDLAKVDLATVYNSLQSDYNKHVFSDTKAAELRTALDGYQRELDDIIEAVDNVFSYKVVIYDDETAFPLLLDKLQVTIDNARTEIDNAAKTHSLTATNSIYQESTIKSNLITYKKYSVSANILGLLSEVNVSELRTIVNEHEYVDETKIYLENAIEQLQKDVKSVSYYNDFSFDGGTKVDINGDDLDTYKYITLEDYWVNGDVYNEIIARIATLNETLETLTTKAEKEYYILGDADFNGRVNVNDYEAVLKLVLDDNKFDELDIRQRYSADANRDGDISVSDAVAVANIIFDVDNPTIGDGGLVIPGQSRIARRSAVQSSDAITLSAESEETSVFGKNIRLAVNLDNSINYVGCQMDIKLPAGMTLVGESLTARANGHELLSNNLNNGMHRVIVSTIENNEFLNDGNAVLYLDVQVGSDYNGGEVEISNVIFSDADARSYNLQGVSTNNPTGIDSITAPTVSERIYSVGGQMMKAVKKGVNIIMGNDGSTKKVIKK